MPTTQVLTPSSSASPLTSDSSSSVPATSLFFLWLPDYTDSDAQRRRAEATPRHLKQMMANVVSKKRDVDYGGVTTIQTTYANLRQAAANNMIDGTIVVIEAESMEAVWKLIEQDVFYTENVWDKERIVIKPFIPTLPHRNTAARL